MDLKVKNKKWPVWWVLVAGGLLSAFATYESLRDVKQEASERFSLICDHSVAKINDGICCISSAEIVITNVSKTVKSTCNINRIISNNCISSYRIKCTIANCHCIDSSNTAIIIVAKFYTNVQVIKCGAVNDNISTRFV